MERKKERLFHRELILVRGGEWRGRKLQVFSNMIVGEFFMTDVNYFWQNCVFLYNNDEINYLKKHALIFKTVIKIET